MMLVEEGYESMIFVTFDLKSDTFRPYLATFLPYLSDRSQRINPWLSY